MHAQNFSLAGNCLKMWELLPNSVLWKENFRQENFFNKPNFFGKRKSETIARCLPVSYCHNNSAVKFRRSVEIINKVCFFAAHENAQIFLVQMLTDTAECDNSSCLMSNI